MSTRTVTTSISKEAYEELKERSLSTLTRMGVPSKAQVARTILERALTPPKPVQDDTPKP